MNGWRRLRSYAPAVLAAVLLAGFGFVADEVIEGDTLDFDRSVLVLLREPGDLQNPLGPPWFEDAARDITALGSVALLTLIVVLVVIHLCLSARRATAAYVSVAVVAGTAISNLLKAIFDRPRPDLTGVTEVFTSSFPSGHATLSAVVYLTLGAILAQRATTSRLRIFPIGTALLLTFLVGVSRVYLGVHYPTDVLAGWAIGGAWAILCLLGAPLIGHRAPSQSLQRD